MTGRSKSEAIAKWNKRANCPADMMVHFGKIIDQCMKIFNEKGDKESFDKIKQEIEKTPGWNDK
jgi:hypothetical protein